MPVAYFIGLLVQSVPDGDTIPHHQQRVHDLLVDEPLHRVDQRTIPGDNNADDA